MRRSFGDLRSSFVHYIPPGKRILIALALVRPTRSLEYLVTMAQRI